MCKKLGVTALVIVAGLFVLHKLDLLGYITSAVKHARQDVSAKISPEMKLERLKDEIAKLGPEERKARSVIASEMVAVDKLKGQIAETKTNLDKRQAQLKDLRGELEKGTSFVTLDNQKIPREKVEASLARQWESFKTAKEALKSQEDLLKSREEALDLAKAKLDAMQDKRKEMEAKVEKMELDLRKLRLAQTRNDIAIDDTQMATVLKLSDEIETQIKTQQTELALQKGADTDEAVEKALAHKAQTDKAMKEMDEFFSGTKVTKNEK
jgi:chromosome segregation ATPase